MDFEARKLAKLCYIWYCFTPGSRESSLCFRGIVRAEENKCFIVVRTVLIERKNSRTREKIPPFVSPNCPLLRTTLRLMSRLASKRRLKQHVERYSPVVLLHMCREEKHRYHISGMADEKCRTENGFIACVLCCTFGRIGGHRSTHPTTNNNTHYDYKLRFDLAVSGLGMSLCCGTPTSFACFSAAARPSYHA